MVEEIEIKDVKFCGIDGMLILETVQGEKYKVVIVKTDGAAKMELVRIES